MAKNNITQYDATAANNTDIDSINIDEGMAASDVNNALRSLMSHLKNVDTGSQALTALSVTGDLTVTGDIVSNTAGTSNFRAGNNAGDAIASGGIRNVVVGDEAGTAITTGTRNVAIGYQALATEDTGSRSIAIGHQALTTQDGGTNDIYNVAVGHNAGGAVTTGVQGVYIGGLAGDADTSGGKNTYVGYNAGTANAGDQNVFIGHSAGSAITDGDKNTIIGKYDGNSDGLDIRTSDNYIVLSDGDGNVQLAIHGDGNVSVGDQKTRFTSNATLNVDQLGSGFPLLCHRDGTGDGVQISFRNDNGQVGRINTSGSATSYVTSSDYRLKENVVDMTGAIDRVKQLSPKRFNFIADADTTVDGFLAHEVESVIPNAVTGKKDAVDENGDIDPQGIDHGFLVPLLTKALQEQQATIEALTARITALENA